MALFKFCYPGWIIFWKIHFSESWALNHTQDHRVSYSIVTYPALYLPFGQYINDWMSLSRHKICEICKPRLIIFIATINVRLSVP